jgi:chromosome segregation ATPase
MAVTTKPPRKFSLFGRRSAYPAYAITGYHLEDIRADEPVYIAPGAIVAGDVYAPQVVVGGLVYGFVVSLAVVLEAGAEVWGDVYAQALQLDTAVQLNGWVSTLNPEEYRALRQSETELSLWMSNRADATLHAVPDELQQSVQDTVTAMPPGRVNILRRLQRQIGAAILARGELEQAFENRVQEIAGEALAEAIRLREQIATLTAEQTTKTEQINQLQTRLQNRETELSGEKQKLLEAQAQIDQQMSRLEEYEAKTQMQELDMAHLRQEIAGLEQTLTQMRLQADEAQARMKNLEIALQSSLQRSADLDEALLRWQELAEANEERVRTLEGQVETATRQAQEQGNTVGLLKDQRDRFEREWEDAQIELEELQRKLAEQTTAVTERDALKPQVTRLQEEVARKEQALLLAQQKLQEQDTAVAGRQALAAQVQTLQEQLQRKEQEFNLTKQAMLESTAVLAQNKRQEEALQQEKATLNKQLQTAQTQVVQLTRELENLRRQAQQAQQPQADPAEMQKLQKERTELQTASKQLKDEMRMMRHQLDAHEADIEHYQQQLVSQGQQLAELRMELVDKQLYLDKVLEAARKQAGELNQIKKMAGQRIKQLEQQLAQAKQG